MRSSFGKLKKLALHKSEDVKESQDHQALAHFDCLSQACEDVKDMRSCYDSLLSAAAATANSAYEFSQSLLEMGNSLLEKTALNDDGNCSGALSMLGRVQLELHKLVDSYRAHVILTITKPSESLLNELRKVEEMKLQCDEKRGVYEYLLTQHKDKGRSRVGKGDSVTSQSLQAARDEYDEVARLCIFRMESLKQGQCRSLFTQAARHHAAQLNFFRRGLESLEAIEPHIKNFAEKQHIDYTLSGFADAEVEEDEANNSYDSDGTTELSFDYTLNKQELDSSGITGNSGEADVSRMLTSGMEDTATYTGRSQGEHASNRQPGPISHSAPLYAEKFDSTEKARDTQRLVRKFDTHLLPTPADAKSRTSRTNSSVVHSSSASLSDATNNLWHSSPLSMEKQRRSTEDNLLPQNISKTQNPSIPLPRPVGEGQSDSQNEFDHKKAKRLAFSGPLASRMASYKASLPSGVLPGFESSSQHSGLPSRIPIPQPASSVNASRSTSPPLASSPRISELHELPRPPAYLASKPVSSGNIGHSAPLVNRKREVSPTNRSPQRASNAGTALPPPPMLAVSRSFSIPSGNQRAVAVTMSKLVGSPRGKVREESAVSPPLTPTPLSNVNPLSTSEVASNSGQIRG